MRGGHHEAVMGIRAVPRTPQPGTPGWHPAQFRYALRLYISIKTVSGGLGCSAICWPVLRQLCSGMSADVQAQAILQQTLPNLL